jgi:hypothetical protein
MEEVLERVVSQPTEAGLAEERMLRAELVQEMVARQARGEGVKRIARELAVAPEETLTVMRLGLPENLERVLSSTNLIKNLFGRVGRRIERWQNGTMVLRWTAAGVVESRARLSQTRVLSRHADPDRRAARSRRAVQSQGLRILKRPLK